MDSPLLSAAFCLFAALALSGCTAKNNDEVANTTASYVIMSFGNPSRIVREGRISRPLFGRLFLRDYAVTGERIESPETASVDGVLVVTDGSSMLALPIMTWQIPSGRRVYLCQGKEFGRPPLFSVRGTTRNGIHEAILGCLAGRR